MEDLRGEFLGSLEILRDSSRGQEGPNLRVTLKGLPEEEVEGPAQSIDLEAFGEDRADAMEDVVASKAAFRNMAKEKIASLPIYPEERECKAPTSPRVFGTFSYVDWYKQVAHDGEAAFPVKLTDTQATILRLLGLPRKLYEGYPFE